MDTEDKLLNFLQYKAFTADERKKYVYNHNPPSKTIRKWNDLIVKNKEYPNPNAVINTTEVQDVIINTDIIASYSTPITDPPLINRAVSFIAELEKSKNKNKSKSKAVVFDTDGEPPATFDILKEWNGDKQEKGTQTESTMDIYSYPALEGQPQEIEPNDTAFLPHQVINDTQTNFIQAQAIYEQQQKAEQEARATATKIIAQAEADAQAERGITNAQAQAEAREIIANAHKEAEAYHHAKIAEIDAELKEYYHKKQFDLQKENDENINRINQNHQQRKQREEQQDNLLRQQKTEEIINQVKIQAEADAKITRENADKYAINIREIAERETEDYLRYKKAEADAYKSPPVKGDISYVFDDVDGLYQFYLTGDYKIEVDRNTEKLFTIQEIKNGEAEAPLFRIKL
jgi:hypothetical protein